MASLARLSSALSDVTYHLSNAPASPAPEQSQNAFGAVTKVIHQDWQAGSSAIEQSSVSGQITSVHSSSESLLSSIPTLYRLSQDRIPTVFHVNARAPSKTSASFHPDHTHVLAIRQTGLGLISSDSPQEALDVALLAHLAALKTGTPVLHFFTAPSVFKADAEAFSPALNQLAEVLPAQQLQEFRQRFAPVKAEKKPAKPAEGEQKPEGGEQPKEQQQQDLVKVIEEISSGLAEKFPGQFGGGYRAFEYHGSEQAEFAIVTLASGSAQIEEAVKALAKSGQKVGILKVRVFRPWSEARFLSVLPKSVRKLAVLEQTAVGGSPSTSWGPLFMDVTTSFHSAEAQQQQPPLIVGGQFGLGGFPLDHSSVASVFANLGAPQPASGFTLQPPSQASPTSAIASPLPGGSPPTAENHYTQMLRQVFGDNLVLSNATGYSTVWGEAKSEAQTQELLKTKASRLEEVGAEFGLGMYLALNQRRERLAEVITRVLGDAQVPKSDELREALRLWLQNREDRKLSRQHANTLGDRLLPKEASNHPALQEILLQRELLPLATNWIVGGDDWAYDMNSSGIHHILSSGEKVNLLILDTEPYTQTVGQGNHATQRKKDIGLYAMNYGGAYVASVALYSSYSQAIRAFVEAATYPGPAIILAYLPKVIAEAQPQERFPTSASAALAVLKETKQAVDAGHWPLYRWNPSLEDESGSAVDTGRGPFALDSQKILQDLQTFLEKENHLSLLTKSDPHFAANLAGSLDQQLKIRHEGVKQAAQDSFSKLLGGLKGGKPLLVLFGSDGGNAEGVARRIEDGAKRRGMDARCLAMDEYPLEDLAAEPTLCVVVSTAGQGEFPTNSREFWKALSNATDLNLANTKFAVFAMGDRHYWPLPEDAVYFCKPGNDLDAKLQLLSAQRLLAPGIGDDQDADGYETGFAAWEPQFWRSLGLPEVIGGTTAAPKAKSVEEIKDDSNFLRGTIMQGLADTSTGAISESDTALTKFHGIYQQDDRDLRDERRKQGLEKAFSFMVRVRVPGGISTPKQWLDMDEIADKHANGTLKLTTRQAFQVHGVLKRNLRQTIRDINKSLMDTIAACGDVNRNVMCNPNPYLSEIHMEVQAFTQRLSDHLTPRTSAYHEIWLEDKQVGGNADVNRPSKADEEPIYGPHYLPRKFKTVVAIPPNNDVDIYAHDLGYIAITEGSKLVGFNVTIGGGMGMTHNNKKTFPRLADLLGFCTLDQAIAVGEAVVTVQRDYGDRTNRKHARLKYTIEDKGLDWYREQVEARVGFKLQPVRPFEFTDNSDRYGWTQGLHGNWHFCMFVQNGRVRDSPNFALKTGLKEIAKVHEGDFRLTPNQNLIIGNITPKNKPVIEALLKKYDITNDRHSALRLNSMACVALPTCGLAFAESERYLPDLVTKIENTIEECGLREDAITIRMTGCPNGCARPYVAEIAFVGKAPGVYNMYLGAGFSGDRLNKLYKESVNEEQILTELKPLLKRYATERLPQEHFGDFVIRAGIVKAVLAGRDFHS